MIEGQNLGRKLNESEADFINRICGYRVEKRWKWQEIADFINDELGYNFSESKYRKNYAREQIAYYKGLEDASGESGEQHEETEFTDKELDLREKYKGASENVPYYRLMRQDSRFERFYKLVGENIKALEPPKLSVDAEHFKRDAENGNRFVMSLADLHIGACFESINNRYSMEIARQRFEFLLDELKFFVVEHDIGELTILSLGDVVQGILRVSDLKLNEAPVVEAFVFAMRLLAEFLNELSRFCVVDFKQICYSNHDQLRPLGTKASELAAEDMGKILLAYLQDVLRKNERVKIEGDVERDYFEFKIFDFNCIALHGHQVKNVKDLYKDLANRHRVFYDYIFLGHSHSTKEFVNAEGEHHDCETLVTSSFCGSDKYSDSLFVGSKASVRIYEFHSQLGRIASYKIILN